MKLGLTGGIGSGKSAVSDLFHNRYQVPIVDADVISKEIVEPGHIGLTKLIDHFGSDILLSDGSLDRQGLRNQMTTDPEVKPVLDSILHPIIQQEVIRQLDVNEKKGCPLVIYDCPLFFQTRQEKYVDKILVVICSRDLRIKRIVKRDHSSEVQAEKMIDLQLSDEVMIEKSDYVINNNGTMEDLQIAVKKLYTEFVK